MNIFERIKQAEEQVTTETRNENAQDIEDLLAIAQVIEDGLTGFQIPTPNQGRRVAALLTGVAFRHWLTAFDLAVTGQYNASLNILRLVALQYMLANYYGVRPRKAIAYMEGPRPEVLRRKLINLQNNLNQRTLLHKKLDSALAAINEGLIPVAEGIIEWHEKRLIATSGQKSIVKRLLKKDFKRGDTPHFKSLERWLKADELDHIALKRLHVDVHARFFNVMEAVQVSGDQLDPSPRYNAAGWELCAVSLLFFSWKLISILWALIPKGELGDQWKQTAKDTHNRAIDHFGQAAGLTAGPILT